MEPNAVRRLEAWLRRLERHDDAGSSNVPRLLVAEQIVSAAVASAGLACQPDTVAAEMTFVIGQAVSGNYKSKGSWYPARIVSGGEDGRGLWVVIYDEDQIVETLPETHLRERVALAGGVSLCYVPLTFRANPADNLTRPPHFLLFKIQGVVARAPAATRGHISSRKASRSALARLQRLTRDPDSATRPGGGPDSFPLDNTTLGPALAHFPPEVLQRRLRSLARLNALLLHILPSVDLLRSRVSEDRWSLSALLARCKVSLYYAPLHDIVMRILLTILTCSSSYIHPLYSRAARERYSHMLSCASSTSSSPRRSRTPLRRRAVRCSSPLCGSERARRSTPRQVARASRSPPPRRGQ